jgi:hypothetical protein
MIVDINIAIDHLGLNANSYKLTQSVPPHSIVEWNGPDAQPTEAELQAAYDAYVAEQAATEYQRNRQPEYPSLADLADALYWSNQGDNTKLDEYYAACAAVKAKYPKPEVN